MFLIHIASPLSFLVVVFSVRDGKMFVDKSFGILSSPLREIISITKCKPLLILITDINTLSCDGIILILITSF